MAQWTKRRGAGVARNIIIGVMIAVMILVLYITGILEIWIQDIDWGIGMFLQEQFYVFLIVIVIIVGIIMFCIRNAINWGGA